MPRPSTLAAPVWPSQPLCSGKGCFSGTMLSNIWLPAHAWASAHMEHSHVMKSHHLATCDPFPCGTTKLSSRAVLRCQHMLCSVNHSTEDAPMPPKEKWQTSSPNSRKIHLSLIAHYAHSPIGAQEYSDGSGEQILGRSSLRTLSRRQLHSCCSFASLLWGWAHVPRKGCQGKLWQGQSAPALFCPGPATNPKHLTAVQLQTRGKAQSRAWICVNLMFIKVHPLHPFCL